jgi:hypothetical protein
LLVIKRKKRSGGHQVKRERENKNKKKNVSQGKLKQKTLFITATYSSSSSSSSSRTLCVFEEDADPVGCLGNPGDTRNVGVAERLQLLHPAGHVRAVCLALQLVLVDNLGHHLGKE